MEEKVLSIIASELKISVDDISLDTEIGEPAEWDSLSNMKIFIELEEAFNIKISNESIADLEDISDIVNLIKELC